MNGSFSTWPAWRKWAAGVLVLLVAVGLAVAATYLAAAILMAPHWLDPRRVVIESLWTYWQPSCGRPAWAISASTGW